MALAYFSWASCWSRLDCSQSHCWWKKRVNTNSIPNEALSPRERGHCHAIRALAIYAINGQQVQELHWSQLMTRHVWWCHSKRSVMVSDQRWGDTREDVGHICLLWLHNGICVGYRWEGPGVDLLQLSSKVPIAVSGRQFIHAPELGCVAEERHASRCWSSMGLKVAEREDDLMSCHWRWRFGFSGSDGLVNNHMWDVVWQCNFRY